MLENLKSGRSRSDVGARSPGIMIMARALLFLSLLSVARPAAATPPENPPVGDKTKLVRICKADIQRFCDQANLKQECLVAHWAKISTECRGVLGTSAGNREGDRS